jgi:hypothetical protein
MGRCVKVIIARKIETEFKNKLIVYLLPDDTFLFEKESK